MKKTLMAAAAAVMISSPAFAVVECIDESFLPEHPANSWIEGSNVCWVQTSIQEAMYMEAHWENLLAAYAAAAEADSSIYIDGESYDSTKLYERWTALLNALNGTDPEMFQDASTNIYSPVYDMSDADFAELIAEINTIVNSDAGKGANSDAWVLEVVEETDSSDNSIKDSSEIVIANDGDFGGENTSEFRTWLDEMFESNTQLGQELRAGLVTIERVSEYDWNLSGTNWSGVYQTYLGFTQF